jgi:hypothetical protein
MEIPDIGPDKKKRGEEDGILERAIYLETYLISNFNFTFIAASSFTK